MRLISVWLAAQIMTFFGSAMTLTVREHAKLILLFTVMRIVNIAYDSHTIVCGAQQVTDVSGLSFPLTSRHQIIHNLQQTRACEPLCQMIVWFMVILKRVSLCS